MSARRGNDAEAADARSSGNGSQPAGAQCEAARVAEGGVMRHGGTLRLALTFAAFLAR